MKYNLNISSSIGKDGLNSGMYPVIIYQLIRQYSNENNKLTMEDILDTLTDYWKGDGDKEFSRKNLQRTVKRNLESLLYFDSKIHAEYKDNSPFNIGADDKIGQIHYLWYEQELSPTDFQLLSDAVIYSKHLSQTRRLEILEKLMAASGQPNATESVWFKTIIKDSDDISIPVPGDLYHNLEYINDAIDNQNCISFDFCFFGPNMQQYKVRSYSGISPYKIIHNDGIYYLVASVNEASSYASMYLRHKNKIPAVYFQIHKMRKIHTDFGHKYTDISKTTVDQMSINDLFGPGFFKSNAEYSNYRFKSNLRLITSSRGLDVLMDHFGNRLHVKKLSKINPRYAGDTPELAYTYEVSISGITRNDYTTILNLMLYYDFQDIGLIEPEHFLSWVTSLLKINLKKLHKYKSTEEE